MGFDEFERGRGTRGRAVLACVPDGEGPTAELTLLADQIEDGPLVAVTAERSGDQFVEEVVCRSETLPSDLRIVDVGEGQRSAAQTTSDLSTPIRGIAGTASPTEVSAELRASLDALDGADHSATVYIESLEPFLARDAPDETVTVLGELLGHLRSAGAATVFQLLPNAREMSARVEPLFDAVVEHRPDDGWVERPAVGALSLDQVFDVLRAERRRHLLRTLSAACSGVPLDDLVEVVAANLSDGDLGTVDVYRRVHVSLFQADIPKLADMGVVSWNREQDVVFPHPPRLDQFDPYLALARDET